MYPFWSPDSQHVAFFSAGRLRRVPVAGGPPQSLCDIEDGRGGTWSRAGEIVFASSWRGGLEAIAASGGARRKLTTPAGRIVVSHRWPWFLPDGKHLLFLAQAAEGGTPGDRSTIELLELASGEHHTLVEANSSMAYSTTGHLLYWRDGALLAHPFDAGAGRMAGDYVPIAEDVAFNGNEFAVFTIAGEGTLVYGADTSSGRASQMVWVDRTGKRLGEITGPGRYYQPALSPDGTRLAYGLDGDLWIHDLEKDHATRFTFGGAVEAGPVWSPDGRWLAYTSFLGGEDTVFYRRLSSGRGEPEDLLRIAEAGMMATWAPDGRHLYFLRFQSGKDLDLWRLDIEDGKTAVVLSTSALEADPALSPDGRWLAYGSNESARFELYVRPLAGQGGRWQLSREGGEQPKWSRDGRALYFLAENGGMMAVEVEAGETFRAAEPVELFATSVSIDESGDFDLHPDGDRFVINWPLTSAEQRAVLVQEWPRLLAAATPR
jgi:eukaryotic-like serine/threonine-protein kinase